MKPAPTFAEIWQNIQDEARRGGPESVEELEDFQAAFRWARELVNARKQKGLSQTAAAERSGIDQAEISRIESGRSNPTMHTLTRLLDTYDVRMHFVPKNDRAIGGSRRGNARSQRNRETRKLKHAKRTLA